MSAEESKAKIEEITDDVPAEQVESTEAEANDDDEEVQSGSGVTIHNRNEKKARKLIAKLNLKKVEGINRVFFKRAQGVVFTISDPEVYRNPATGTYVVFGEAKVDTQSANMAAQLAGLQQQAAAGQAPEAAAAAGAQADKDPASIQKDLEAAVASTSLEDKEVDDANVDTSGLSEEDIKLVMDQANVTKSKAVNALRKNNSDIVNTIMELTS
uniref:Nascent polypeptide-associated complex subunit alpha n=1 Tax=Blastobotrys adeninivorans TaxID=409370 RepID=A0A060T643_BLAAD